ncbi:hypothetical protein [Methanobacterium paludis]|nr:hypothetical protein [Methanobacterium paludis]
MIVGSPLESLNQLFQQYIRVGLSINYPDVHMAKLRRLFLV